MPETVAAAVTTYFLGAGATGVAATAVYATAYVATVAAASYAIGAAAQSLAKKPQTSTGLGGGSLVTTRQAAGSWRLIYGERRVGGQLVYVKTTVPVGPVQFQESHIIPSSLQVSVNQAGANFQSTVVVQQVSVDESFFATYTQFTEVASAPGIGQYSVSGGVYTFNAAHAGQQIEVFYLALGGTGVANQAIHMVIVWASHECHAIDGLYFNNELVPIDGGGNCVSGKYAGRVRARHHLGDISQTADTDLIFESEGQWTSAHRLQGQAYTYLRIIGSQTVFPSGLPNITAQIRGKKDIFDPRIPGSGYSTNAALCVANYLCSPIGMGCTYASEIHEATLIAEANICDEVINLNPSGTELRYALNAVIDTASSVEDNVKDLLTAMGGSAVWSGGRWYIRSAHYVSPTLTLDESDARDGLRIMPAPSRREKFNAVKGTFIGPHNQWQPADYPAITSATYETADGGERIYADVSFPSTISGPTCQRLAKIELLRHRQGLTVQYPARLIAAQLMIGDTVQINNTRMGWSAKVFEVLGWEFVLYPDDAGEQALGVDLTLRETASSVFAWGSGEEQVLDLAPNTTLPSPFVVQAVSGLTAASGEDHATVGSDGQVVPRMLVSWNAPTGAYLDRGRIQVESRRSTETAYRRVIDEPSIAPPTYWGPISVGATYFLRARWQNQIGIPGPWSAPLTHVAQSIAIPPADVTGFFVDGLRLTWTPVVDPALAGYRIKFHQGINRSWGNAIAMHSGLVTASPWDMAAVPSGQTTMMIKAVDRLGNESVNAASIVTDLGDALVANIVLTKDFDALGYPGTLTGGVRSGGNLNADTLGNMWDPNPDRAMWTTDGALMWQSSYQAMTYEDTITISSTEDGATMTLSLTAAGDSITIEYRPEGPDLLWSEVADDPLWTTDPTLLWHLPGYQPWPGSIVVAPDIYDLRVTTGFGATPGQISLFSALVDVPDIIEHLNDVAIASGGTRLTLAEVYRVVKNVQLTLQTSGSSALTAKALDKDAVQGPLVQCFNTSGTGVAGTVDATVQGY